MDELKSIVEKKLRKYTNLNYSDLKPLTQKMLLEIEQYIIKAYGDRSEAIRILKNEKINIKKITDNTSVSKGTIYNNPSVLKKYIDENIKENDENEKKYYNPERSENLMRANLELMNVIDDITVDLIDLNNMRLANDKLISENDILRTEIDELNLDKQNLLKEIRECKKQIRDLIKNGNNVIDISAKSTRNKAKE